MINPRPRALAAIEICRALVRFEMPLTDDARARLEDVYAGLSDPW
jgi:hypothetical protein